MKKLTKTLIKDLISEIMIGDTKQSTPIVEEHEWIKQANIAQIKYFRISREEEQRALQFILRKFLPYLVELFHIQYKSQFHHSPETFYKLSAVTPQSVARSLKKISEKINNSRDETDFISYSSPLFGKYTLEVHIFKDDNGILAVGSRNPINGIYRKFAVTDQREMVKLSEIFTGSSFNGKLKETINNKEDTNKKWGKIEKLEEAQAFHYIQHVLVPLIVKELKHKIDYDIDEKEVLRGIKKILHQPLSFSEGSLLDIIGYRFKKDWMTIDFLLRKFVTDTLVVGIITPATVTKYYKVGTNPPFKTFMPSNTLPEKLLKSIKETVLKTDEHNTTPKDLFTKEEINRTGQYINDLIKRSYGSVAKNLKRVPDKRPNAIRFTTKPTDPEGYFNFRAVKIDGQISIVDETNINDFYKSHATTYVNAPWFSLGDLNAKLTEQTEPNLNISKQEEKWALARFCLRTDVEGEKIGRYLRKIKHQVGDGKTKSDEIVYKNTEDATTFTICKDEKGTLGYKLGFLTPEPYTSSHIEYFTPIPLKENHPSGNWKGWGTITKLEKDRLKIVLEALIRFFEHTYHPQLSNTKTFLIQKCIDNLDTTDPRFAAKPLAHLSMDDRITLEHYVASKDTTGKSSEIIDFLMQLSSIYIEQPKRQTPDIVIRSVADVSYGHKSTKGDVKIFGLMDMRPVISIAGYPSYPLDDDFIKEFSKPGSILYVDVGQGIKITNMKEVIQSVETYLKQWKNSNDKIDEAMDPERYHQAIDYLIKIRRFTKMEEDLIVNHLQKKIVNGELVGKTLKKTSHQVTNDPQTGDMLTYSAKPKGQEIFYRVIKTGKGTANVLYFSNVDGRYGYDKWKITLSENNTPEKNLVLTKQDEDRAVEFLKRQSENGIPFGKTLKKIQIAPSPSPNLISDLAIYSVHVGEIDYSFEIFRSTRRGLIIRDGNHGITYTSKEHGIL